MKIVFAGTPEFAVAPLVSIVGAGFNVVAVLTRPDKPQGRRAILTPSPVKAEALARGIPVIEPERLKTDFSALKAVGADLMVTCAYGQILTQEILDLFPMGVWNIHASMLPRYRGAAPIQRAILDGAPATGITVMKTDVGLDTGDILLAREVGIFEKDTAGTLGDRMSHLAAEIIPGALELIESGNYVLTKQGEGTACGKVHRTEVDFTQPAPVVARLIRGLSPAPGSWAACNGLVLNFFLAMPVAGAGAPGVILSAEPKTGLVVACGEGAVRISELQPAGGKRMTDAAFLNGRKLERGMKFEPLS